MYDVLCLAQHGSIKQEYPSKRLMGKIKVKRKERYLRKVVESVPEEPKKEEAKKEEAKKEAKAEKEEDAEEEEKDAKKDKDAKEEADDKPAVKEVCRCAWDGH